MKLQNQSIKIKFFYNNYNVFIDSNFKRNYKILVKNSHKFFRQKLQIAMNFPLRSQKYPKILIGFSLYIFAMGLKKDIDLN